MKKEIWNNMMLAKFGVFYLELYIDRARKNKYTINIAVALTTFGGLIGLWITHDFLWLWTLVIVLAQFLNLSLMIIPSIRYLRELSDMYLFYEVMYVDYTFVWKEAQKESRQDDVRRDLERLTEKHAAKQRKLNLLPDTALANKALNTWKDYVMKEHRVDAKALSDCKIEVSGNSIPVLSSLPEPVLP